MVSLISILIRMIIDFIILAISALPLYIAVKLLNGRTGIIKAIFVMLITGIIYEILRKYIGIAGIIIAFLASVWVYREFFRLKWIKALVLTVVAWLVVVLFYLLMLAFLVLLDLGTAIIAVH